MNTELRKIWILKRKDQSEIELKVRDNEKARGQAIGRCKSIEGVGI